MKPGIRVIGFDDGPFDKFKEKEAVVIGAFFRGGSQLDGILKGMITIDGDDSTVVLIDMIKKSKFFPQLQAILLDGIAMGGFNVINIQALARETNIPVIVVMRDFPQIERMKDAMRAIGMEQKIALLDKAGKIHDCDGIHIQYAGCDLGFAKEIIDLTTVNAMIPEPLRQAHIIATGIVFGESKGKA